MYPSVVPEGITMQLLNATYLTLREKPRKSYHSETLQLQIREDLVRINALKDGKAKASCIFSAI